VTTDPQRPEVDDPRVLALAKARQQMAHENPFNAGFCPPWGGLSEQEQHLSLLDARNYLRAALKAGLFASSAVSVVLPATNQALRDRLRRAVCEAEGFAWDSDMLEPDEYGEVADMVLAVLPAPADRAATLREAADTLGRMDYDTDSHDYGYDTYRDAWNGGVMDGADKLRRMAVEAEQAGGPSREATEPQPETQTAPTAADVQHMLARMRTDAATHDLGHLLGLLARWAASSEGRDVLLDDLIAGGYRLPHACGNCEGIDPDSCLKNPDRAAPAVSSRPGTEQEA
jgi:hypothetical protein